MKIAFAGTPAFAATALQALHEAGHHIVMVLTQPDRPAGRGLKLQASAVKQLALSLDCPVLQPRSLRLDGKFPDDAAAALQALTDARPDVMVVAAYGLILPEWTLTLPALGCINIHASLLPRWRGAAPIHRAIEAGDARTGITIMQMDQGLDTGDMLLVGTEPIAADDNTARLHDRLAALGARLIVQALAQLPTLPRQPQPRDGICYAHKVEKAESSVDWRSDAVQLERRIRAFDPFPGSHALVPLAAGDAPSDVELKLWRCRVVEGQGDAGQRLLQVPGCAPDAWVVACGSQALELLEVQQAGGKRLSAPEVLKRLTA